MAYRCAFASLAVAAALLAGAQGTASAQCRLCSTPTTAIGSDGDGAPLQLEVETSLDFDRLILLGAGTGVATLMPSGERSATGTVATIGASAMVGSVRVRGQAGRALRIDLPARIDLYSVNGSRISIDKIDTDLPDVPRLDGAGNLSFHFGGTLTIIGEADGDYRGDLPITADYL